MDTKQINDAQDRIFHEEARNLFWNDTEREFLKSLAEVKAVMGVRDEE